MDQNIDISFENISDILPSKSARSLSVAETCLSKSRKNNGGPAAVFYFGFDGTLSTTTITKTGTAFYREKESGLERATSIVGNETDFCAASPNSL